MKTVGFEKTPALLETIAEDVKPKLLADTRNKQAYCSKLAAKYQQSIQQVIKSEDARMVIHQFLCGSCLKTG